MRPQAPDIAAPEFPPRLRWVGDAPASMAGLTATGPVLVHFFDFAQLNCIRALPYVLAWSERYADYGLTTVGVHSPRFPFTADAGAVTEALERFEIVHPVAIDSSHDVWTDYGCEGWPSLFLWGQGGMLRWAHFGEGEYLPTEKAIQEALREAEPLRELPDLLMPLRSTDLPDARVMPPTPEFFPGGSPDEPWLGDGEEEIQLSYEAGGVSVTIEGPGELRVSLDPSPEWTIDITHPGLYEIAVHGRHESHQLVLGPAFGQQVYSVSFAPGIP
jgi:hypothetical protein